MYKVFTEKSIIIIDEKSDFSEHNDSKVDIQWFKNQLLDEASLITKKVSNPKQVFEALFADYTIIEAAGGLVFNSKGAFLVIRRLGKWDLPKGKIEKGESIEDAAVREVEEECGISGVFIEKQLIETYHTYEIKGTPILKRTYWFEMYYKGDEQLVPQTEEDITEVKWLDWSQKETIFSNTYENIKDVIAAK